MVNLENLHKNALALHAQGRLTEAEQTYQKLLNFAPDHGEAWSDLGILYDNKGEHQKALAALERGLKLVPLSARHLCRLGWVLHNLGQSDGAIQAYQDAIALNPTWADAYLHLSQLWFNLGKLPQAKTVCLQALSQGIQNPSIYQILGQIYLNYQQFDEAISAYSQALNLMPNHPILLKDLGSAYQEKAKNNQIRADFYLGCAAYRENNYPEAIAHLQKFLQTPRTLPVAEESIAKVYMNLAECFFALERYEEAIQTYRDGIAAYPHLATLYSYFITLLSKLGRTEEAKEIATTGCDRCRDNLHLQAAKFLELPILYDTPEEITSYRIQFSEGLKTVLNQISLDTPEVRRQALEWIPLQNNFYLSYQGYNDVTLLRRYGTFIHQFLSAEYPDWTKPLSMPPLSNGGKIRVGYLSPFLCNHTVGKLFLGWLRHSDRQQFEIFSYSLSSTFDGYSNEFQTYSDSFHSMQLIDKTPQNLERVAQRILDDCLHILVYFDIGMQTFTPLLAGLRLAPIQCVTWGHPITSGLPTIDYFLSSRFMEPDNAAAHYSERVVLLPKTSISYRKPVLPPLTKTRAYFQLRDDAVIYLSCQSLFKYLPQYDYIFAEIACQVPQAQFVFISRLTRWMTDKFWQRLHRAFGKVGLNAQEFCRVLPKQDQVSYWNLNLLSDIFLDTLNWSGGNTTLEAIACGLPIVTCPGEFMRGRHSAAILYQLGVTDTLAKSEADYIEIAVRLGLDSEWRMSLIERMKQRQVYLYDDRVCVAGLEAFYKQVVGERMRE